MKDAIDEEGKFFSLQLFLGEQAMVLWTSRCDLALILSSLRLESIRQSAVNGS